MDAPSCHLLCDHFQFTLIHGPNNPVSYAILFFIALDFTSITSHIHNWASFLLLFSLFILSGAISPVFIPIPKKSNAKECSNYLTIPLISHASKVTLKILQARLQQYVNWELQDIQDGFRKGRWTRDQIASIHWIIEKAREFSKNNYFCFVDYANPLIVDNKLWKILQEMGIPDNLTCLLRYQYASQEATVRKGHGKMDWFQTGKGVQGCVLSPCLFNLYSESVSQFSHSVLSNSLRHNGLQHARPPCPSPTPGVYSNSCSLVQWCHPTISSSEFPFSCLQSFPASGSFQMSQFFASGGQSIGVSASASVIQSI